MSQYFIKRGEKIHGPFTTKQVKSGLDSGKLTDADLISESKSGPYQTLKKQFSEPTDVGAEEFLAAGDSFFEEVEVPAGATPIAQFSTPNESESRKINEDNPNLVVCPDCNGIVSKRANACPHCGSPLVDQETLVKPVPIGTGASPLVNPQQQVPQQTPSGPQAIGTSIQSAVANLNTGPERKEYYEKVFTEIEAGGGGFRASWNWYSFFFGIFIYLHSGLWIKALLMLAACFVLAGVPAPFFWLYCGLCFNYDLYLKKVKNKDLW